MKNKPDNQPPKPSEKPEKALKPKAKEGKLKKADSSDRSSRFTWGPDDLEFHK